MKIKAQKGKIFATPAQTQRWIKCILAWAKANDKSNIEIGKYLGFGSKVHWYRLMDGRCKRARLELIESTTKQLGLDANFINGLFDYKSKFSEARNIFNDFKEVYAAYVKKGNAYLASQIVRKAALFVYETLVPKDLFMHLDIINRKNNFESANIICSTDDIEFFKINIYGGPQCVMFTMSKKVGNVEIPIMEGDLDIHALSAIRMQVAARQQKFVRGKKSIEKFEDNAKKFAT